MIFNLKVKPRFGGVLVKILKNFPKFITIITQYHQTPVQTSPKYQSANFPNPPKPATFVLLNRVFSGFNFYRFFRRFESRSRFR